VRRAAHQIAAICGREIDFGEQIGSRLLPMRPRCSLAVPRDQARDQAHRAARRHGAAPLRPSAATAHRAHLSKTWARSADLLHAIQADARADFAFLQGICVRPALRSAAAISRIFRLFQPRPGQRRRSLARSFSASSC
jgi:hypothetical protein